MRCKITVWAVWLQRRMEEPTRFIQLRIALVEVLLLLLACPSQRCVIRAPAASQASFSPSFGPPISVTTLAPMRNDEPPVYELVPHHELPTLDPTKTIKSVIFTVKQLSIVNQIGYQGHFWFSVMFLAGNLLTFVIVTMLAGIGQWLSVLAVVLQLPGVFFTAMAICYEMLRLLVRTYGFWFFTVVNLMFTASFMALLGGWRTLVLLNGAYMIQIGIIADAQLGNLKALVVLAMFNRVCHTVLFSLVLFRFVDKSKCVIMLHYSRQDNVVTTRNMLLNSMVKMIILFTRLWYRKRSAMKE